MGKKILQKCHLCLVKLPEVAITYKYHNLSCVTNTYLRFRLNFYPMITKLHFILLQHYSLIQSILLIYEILVPCFSNLLQPDFTITCFTFKSMNRMCAVKRGGTPNGTLKECNRKVIVDGRGAGHQPAGSTGNNIQRYPL